jgi:hypothetical protein
MFSHTTAPFISREIKFNCSYVLTYVTFCLWRARNYECEKLYAGIMICINALVDAGAKEN